MERSLVLIKPDAMERELAGVIIGRIQGEGLRLIALKMLHMDKALAQRHYALPVVGFVRRVDGVGVRRDGRHHLRPGPSSRLARTAAHLGRPAGFD